jgi:tetratricopeptide (TPR) repeat protein
MPSGRTISSATCCRTATTCRARWTSIGPQALINQGGALLDSGDVAGARQSLEAAKRIAPDDVFLLAAYADLAFAENQPDEAVRLLAEASRRAPKNPTFLTKAGNIEFGRGRTAEAEALWRQALQVNPADTLPMLMLAQSYEIAGRGSELEPFFRDAADYAPDDAEMQAQHAEYARRAQNLATALRRADRAVALAPAVSAYRVTRAWVLRDMLRFDEALADFDVAIGLEPGKAGLLYDRARTLQLADRRAEAVAAYRLFVEKAPEDMYAPLARQVIAELSKPPEAVPATP